MARAAGIISAAERPCTIRKTTIQVSAIEPVGVAPHRPDATVKPTMPM